MAGVTPNTTAHMQHVIVSSPFSAITPPFPLDNFPIPLLTQSTVAHDDVGGRGSASTRTSMSREGLPIPIRLPTGVLEVGRSQCGVGLLLGRELHPTTPIRARPHLSKRALSSSAQEG